MTTAQQSRFGDRSRSPSYYDAYSPPVSPKSQPHSYKRKASAQDDELENQNLISKSLKKLRLSKPLPHRKTEDNVLNTAPDNAEYQYIADNSVAGLPHVDVTGSHTTQIAPSRLIPQQSHFADQGRQDEDDYMPLDDTADRVWVHDLNAEIAEIEAEEARNNVAMQLSEAASQVSKIPDHLLKQHALADNPAANMQMVLYREPISISLPEEEDAVRKTFIEARKRLRDKQHEGPNKLPELSTPASSMCPEVPASRGYQDDDVDMDLD